jgi:stearoyl-CoA desaturase (delta-9 desaturase)
MYAFTGFGITMEYHRLWAHKSFKATNILKALLAFAGAGAAQGSIIWWTRLHRLHHRKSDTVDDPYGPQKGFLYSHILWIFENRQIKALKQVNINDLKNDPIIYFQHKFYIPISLISGILLPMFIQYYILNDFNLIGIICYPIAIARCITWHSTWFVNSLAHWLGDQPFSKTDKLNVSTSRDHLITALLTLGEGYHNFHHEFPYDFRNAIKWYQYDPTKWLIILCEFFGLVYDKKIVPNNVIQMSNSHKITPLNEYKKMSLDEYKKKSQVKNLIIYNNSVYNVTDFIDEHPGGSIYILNSIGKTDNYVKNNMNNLNNHTHGALNLLETFKIAELID